MRPAFASLLLLGGIAACSDPDSGEILAKAVQDGQSACELVIAAITARDHIDRSVIAGCDQAAPSKEGYVALRLNGVCQQDICGSVLMGWFAVDVESRRVFELDIETWSSGPVIGSLDPVE